MHDDIEWETISFVMASKIRLQVLISLKKGVKTPKMLSTDLNSYLSHVSRALKQLSERGLVECLTPDVRKNKFYGITEEGKQILIAISNYTR